MLRKRGGGNAGLLKAAIIHGLCDVLAERSGWRKNPKQLFDAVEHAQVKKFYQAAARIAAVDGGAMRAHFATQMKKVLDPQLQMAAA